MERQTNIWPCWWVWKIKKINLLYLCQSFCCGSLLSPFYNLHVASVYLTPGIILIVGFIFLSLFADPALVLYSPSLLEVVQSTKLKFKIQKSSVSNKSDHPRLQKESNNSLPFSLSWCFNANGGWPRGEINLTELVQN